MLCPPHLIFWRRHWWKGLARQFRPVRCSCKPFADGLQSQPSQAGSCIKPGLDLPTLHARCPRRLGDAYEYGQHRTKGPTHGSTVNAPPQQNRGWTLDKGRRLMYMYVTQTTHPSEISHIAQRSRATALQLFVTDEVIIIHYNTTAFDIAPLRAKLRSAHASTALMQQYCGPCKLLCAKAFSYYSLIN